MDKLHFSCERPSMIAIMLLLEVLLATLDLTDAQTGVCYGVYGGGSGLPAAEEVIALYKQYGIRRMRIYHPRPATLEALRGTDIELMIDVPNPDLQRLASSQAEADSWIQYNVKNYSDVKIRYIAVGNKVDPYDSDRGPFLLTAMQNVRNAIVAAGFGNRTRVSTVIGTELLGNIFPPSKAYFKPEIRFFIDPIIEFLANNNSTPLLFLNLYPYLTYAGDTGSISLDYALFTAPSVVVSDGSLEYQNLFDEMLDAVYAALEEVGGGGLEIVVSESGWPTAGGNGATVENAMVYNNNLIQHAKQGTPKKPGRPIEAYILGMFDEDRKLGDEIEKHWGLFLPNKQLKYPITKFLSEDDNLINFSHLILSCYY